MYKTQASEDPAESSSGPDLMIAASCLDSNLHTEDAESVYSCIHKSLATLFPPSQASSQTVLCQVLSVVNSCYRGDALQYLLHFLFPAKQLLETLQQEACEQQSSSPPACWPLCLQERLVVQLCPLDHRLLRSGDFYLLVSPLSPPGARSAPCRSDGARLLLCSVLAGGRHVEQQEVPAVALPSLFSMAWLDSVNREREQRGVPPLQRCAVSTQRDVFTLPWEDLVYPQCTSRPRAASKEEVKTDILSPTAKPPPSAKTDQSATSDGDESEGDYVELTERPMRLSPQKGSLTQSISQLFRTRAHTQTPAQNSTHMATQPLAASKTTHSTTQHAAHNTTQHSERKTSQNATQPADVCTVHSATQPTANNTAHNFTQPLIHDTTTQPSEHKTTHRSTQHAAHNTINTATQLSEHKTTHNAPLCTDHCTKHAMKPLSENQTTQSTTQLYEYNESPGTTQSAAKNKTHNDTQLSEPSATQNTTQPTTHNDTQLSKHKTTQSTTQYATHSNTQPSEHNTINHNTQLSEHTTTERTTQPAAQSKTHNITQLSEHKTTQNALQTAAHNTTHSDTQLSEHKMTLSTTQSAAQCKTHNDTHISEHKTALSTTQPAAQSKTHNDTQLSEHKMTLSATRPASHNTICNDTQHFEHKTTPSATQPAAQNTTHKNTQPAAHNTTRNDAQLFEHKTTPSTTQSATQSKTHNDTQLSEHKTTLSATQPTSHNTRHNNTQPAAHSNTQPSENDTKTSTTQPSAHNTINNDTQLSEDTATQSTTQSAAQSKTHNISQLSEHKPTLITTQPAAHNTIQLSEHNTTQPTDQVTTHTITSLTQIDAHNTKHTKTHPTDYNDNAQPATHTPECTNTHLVMAQPEQLTHTSVHSAALIHTAVSSRAPEDQSSCSEEQIGGEGLMRGCSSDHREQEDQERGTSQRSLCVVEDEVKQEVLQRVRCRSEEEEEEEEQSKSEKKEDEEDGSEEGSEEVELEEEVQVTIIPLPQEWKEKREQEHLKYSYSETTTHCKHTQDSYCETDTFKSVQDIYSESTTICITPQDSYSEEYSENTTSEISYFEIKQKDSEMLDSCSESDTLNTQPKYTQVSCLEENEENSLCETRQQLPVMDSSEKSKETTSDDFYSENTNQQKLCKNSENSSPQSETVTNCKNSTDNGCSYFENTALAKPEDSYCESRPPQDSMKLSVEIEEKEQDKRTGSEGVGGGAKHQGGDVDIQPENHVSAGSCPTEPSAASSIIPEQLHQSSQSRFYRLLLRSGAVCLPGVRDRGRRPLLTVCSDSSIWSHPLCNSPQLLRLLLYYTSTLGMEVRESGLTVLVDARSGAPCSTLFSALRALQEDSATSIHSVLILTNKESTLRLDKPAATQVEVLTSVRSLQKHVELKQLPADFGGTFNFSQKSWVSFRGRVEQLTSQCEDVIDLLQKAIKTLQNTTLPAAAQDAEQLLERNKALMQDVLGDGRLVRLQQEGGAMLSRLRREDGGADAAEDQRLAVETVSALYEEVDELLHRLVTLSNARTQELSFIVDFKKLEEGFSQVSAWMQEVGEPSLQSLCEPEDSLERLVRRQQMFKEFYANAYDHCKHGEELLTRMERWSSVPSADLVAYEVKLKMFWSQLHDFSERVHKTGHNLDRVVQLYRFLDQAYGWALAGMRYLSTVSMEDCTLPDKCQTVIGCLEDFQRQHPPISDTSFQEMKALAGELRGEQGVRHWSFAWSKCQETKRMLDRKMEAALRARDSTHRNRTDSASNRRAMPFRRTLSELWGVQESPSSSPQKDVEPSLGLCSSSVVTPHPTPPTPSTPSTPSTPGLSHHLVSSPCDESSDRLDSLSFTPSLSTCSLASSNRRQQLRKTQSLDCPSTPDVSRYSPSSRALSEPVRTGNTGVFIKGLEISSTEAADRTMFNRTSSHSWVGHCPSPRTRTPGTPRASSSPAADLRPRGSKLRHIVQEMVTTEREYVRSLSYIMDQYLPEMERADLPQDLRGKRSVVFGNLEKLLDFHSQFFLKELESCWRHPLRVSHCFLRHQEQFSLYALYSKNKPKSDSLLANHGHSFFRRKQMQLGDKMDLSSYLLKPVQRMSKYALLLSDLMKEVEPAQEAELVSLQEATNMVKFQLRHGNDLLAMDAIRDCDVNLKEQGQLIRQDEFNVCSGRRKCQRRIFLFEELILFSKPKKVDGGLDIFTYKHSFKTADVGLTESTGDSGLQFEIWFRRRTSKNQTFNLQANSAEVRHAWTRDIARILWTQANKNKEMRLKEMVSMGVGNKPFLDIQPSDAAISDRAVHYIMKSRGARTRASIAVSVLDHINPFKRGVVTSDSSVSAMSSNSLLGSLNLHMFSQSQSSSSPTAETSFSSSCIEEDEQEHETSSQPSMTTESSGSSSRCLSGSTGSDSGCVSSHLQEALLEDSSKQLLNSSFISAEVSPALSPATVV